MKSILEINKYKKCFNKLKKLAGYLDAKKNATNGEMAEWSNAAVLKTVEGHTSGGSNPSFSAKGNPQRKLWVFCFLEQAKLA